MIVHLAQTSTYAVPDGLATWLACLLFLASLAVAIKKLREKPLKEPLRVQTEDSGVPRTDYDRDQKTLDDRLTAATRARKDIHQLLSRHDSRITALETIGKDTTRLHARIDDVERRVDHIPQRVIELLVTTKQYHATPPVTPPANLLAPAKHHHD